MTERSRQRKDRRLRGSQAEQKSLGEPGRAGDPAQGTCGAGGVTGNFSGSGDTAVDTSATREAAARKSGVVFRQTVLCNTNVVHNGC